MDKLILEKLSKNIFDISDIYNQIAMVELAIYQKSVEELKEKKIKELKRNFEQSATVYNQKSEKYSNEINSIIEKYENQIDKLVNVYDDLFLSVFKIMENALNNQKIAISNIVLLKEKQETNNLEDEEIKNKIIAIAQKKLNYEVIIQECNMRLKWTIDDLQNSLNDIFKSNYLQVQNDNNIIIRLKNGLLNRIFGKRNYIKFLENYEKFDLKKIEQKNNEKILQVAAILKAVTKQMDMTKKQIKKQYEKSLYFNSSL